METPQTKLIKKYYHHIDNGGIEVEVNQKIYADDCKVNSLSLSTQYHGYSNVTATLEGFQLTPKVLEEIGLFLIECALNIRALEVLEK